MKARFGIAIALALLISGCVFAQDSNRGTAEATVNGKKVSINYGRPMLKGRDIFALASAGMVWRLGMNQATEIASEGDLVVGGTTLKAGKYSLWAKKTGADSWILEFHPKTGVWGAPPLTEGFVAGAPLKLKKVSDSAEQLTISLNPSGNKCEINVHWGTGELVGSFEVQ